MLRRGWDAWCVFWARARRNRNENENEPRQGGASTSKKLLAAIAVLAVAFAVFAAIPVAVDDSDAGTAAPSYTEGVILAGYAKDAELAAGMVNLITGSGLTTADVADSTVFMAFHFDGDKYNKVEYSRSVDGTVVTDPAASVQEKENGTFGENTVYYMFTVQKGIDTAANADCIVDDWSAEKIYTLTVKLTGPNGASKTISADVKGETITLYQDVDAKVAGPFVAKNGNDVVIDLNDHKLEINNTATDKNRTFTAAEKSSLTIVGEDKSKSVLEINGTAGGTASAIVAEKGASVTIKNVTYNTNGAALLPKSEASHVTIENSDVTAPAYAVATNNLYLEGIGTGVQIKVIGSTLKSDETPVCINANGVALTIQDSMIEGKRHAVMVRSGAADIFNSTLISNNGTCAEESWGQGNDVTPATLFVGNKASSDSYKGTAKVTMTGGSIVAMSGNAIATTNYDATGKTAVDVSISTTITCGTGEDAVSIGVSDFKYTATADKNPVSPLLVKCGSVALSGTIDSLTVVDGDATVSENLTIVSPGKLVVSSGATLTIANGKSLNIDSGATLTVEGSITGSINGAGKVIVQNGDISGAAITGVTIEDESDDSSKKTITWKDGEIDYYADGNNHVINSNQIINIEGKVILVSNSQLTIAGKLVIPEGSELIIESGATLSFVNGGTLAVEGTLTIDGADEDEGMGAGELLLDSQSKAEISGNLTVNGTVAIDNKSEAVFKQDSSALVAATGKLNVINGSAVVDASAVLTVNGALVTGASGKIENNGTVVIDSSVKATAALTISNVANGAVVDVVKFTGTATLTVNDNGLVYTTYRDSVAKKDVEVTDSKTTAVTVIPSVTGAGSDKYVASVSGLKIVSVTSSAKKTSSDTGGATAGIDKNGNKWSKSMDIAGSVSAAYALDVNKEAAEGDQPVAKAAIGTTADSKGFAVTGELALGDNVALTNSAEVSVTGTLSAVKSATITNNGKITVTGEGEVSKVDGTVAKTVSTLYTTSVKDSAGTETKTNHYVNIDKALVVVNTEGSAVKTLTLQDEQTVKISASLPADVTLEIVKGATVKGTGSTIAVGGTLYAQDKTNVSKVSTIESDVYTEEIGEDGKAVKNGWAKWTNLTSALEDAKSGDKIVLHDDVVLDSNTTVPEGVTVDADGNCIKLADGVTLTVNGILIADAKNVYAQSAFATEAKKVSVDPRAYSSAIVVNGKLVSTDKFVYKYSEPTGISGVDTEKKPTYLVQLFENCVIAGAYYEDKDGNYIISSLQIAQNEFADIVGDVITVNGAVTAGDLSFTATEDCFKITVGAAVARSNGANEKIETVLTVSSLTLSGMTLQVDGKITGSVAVGDAAVDMKAVTGISITSDDSKLAFTGTVVLEKSSSMTVSKGTVYAGAKDATTSIQDDSGNDKNVVFTVASGAALEISGNVTVDYMAINGTVTVPSAKTLTVKEKADIAGAVTVAVATDSKAAGTFNVAGELYMGITSDDIKIGASASFSGPVTVSAGKKILVAADASVDDAFKASVKNLKNTEFYVQGSLWFTAYANGENVKIKVNEIPVENVKLSGWSETEGGQAVTATDFTYTIGDSGKLFAVIKTDVYDIIIKADEGIDNVYLDGQLMTYGMIRDSDSDNYAIFYAYTATVAAGDHKVTYTLKNGYSGEATLYSDGKAVAGNTIKSTGDFKEPSVFTLSGVEKSGYVEPVTPSEDNGDDGLTITDYLLIVLVVLIVIMAVIVAMRLMRS